MYTPGEGITQDYNYQEVGSLGAILESANHIWLSISVCWFVFFFWPNQMAFGILVLQPGIEPAPLSVKEWSPNHWTTRESLCLDEWMNLDKCRRSTETGRGTLVLRTCVGTWTSEELSVFTCHLLHLQDGLLLLWFHPPHSLKTACVPVTYKQQGNSFCREMEKLDSLHTRLRGLWIAFRGKAGGIC